MSGRYVLVGLAGVRSAWFSHLARWSTSGLVDAEYLKALSTDEVLAILGSGRRVSAVLVSASCPGLDREFVAHTGSLGARVFIVADGSAQRDWESLGATSVLPGTFGPDDLSEELERHARRIDPTARRSSQVAVSFTSEEAAGTLVAVTGAGGAGVSTCAMALAQGLAAHERGEVAVALAELTRRCDLAMYHDVGDVIPGLPELVEAHRGDTPDPEQVRRFLFPIPSRGYDLLLGQRRSRDSAAMAPLSTAAAIDGLRRAYATVVADVDPTVDGETETGSLDIELFNAAQRHAFSVATVIVVVTPPGVRGLRRMAALLQTLGAFGVPAERLLPVINHAPRSTPARASLTRLVADLNPLEEAVQPVVFSRRHRLLEEAQHQVTPLPHSLVAPLSNAVAALVERTGTRPAEPTRVAPVTVDPDRIRVA